MVNKISAIPIGSVSRPYSSESNKKVKTSGHVTMKNCTDNRDPNHPVPVILKMNKHAGDLGIETSELEVAFGGFATLMMRPGLTPTQNIVLDKTGKKVWGVASESYKHQMAAEREQGSIILKVKNDKGGVDFNTPLGKADDLTRGYTFLEDSPVPFDQLLRWHKKPKLLDIDMDSLASILTASYVLEEDDLHKGNIGYYLTKGEDDRPKVTFFKIDHDLMFADSIMSWRDMRKSSCFYTQDSFKMTVADFERFPDIQDSGNHYWPTTKSRAVTGKKAYHNADERQAFKDLNKDPAFIEAKWTHFLKYSLMPPELIMQSLTHYLDDTNDKVQITMIRVAMEERLAQFRKTLLATSGFQKFMSDNAANRVDILGDIKAQYIANITKIKGNLKLAESELINRQFGDSCQMIEDALDFVDHPLQQDIVLGSYAFLDTQSYSVEESSLALAMACKKMNQAGPNSPTAFEYACVIVDVTKRHSNPENLNVVFFDASSLTWEAVCAQAIQSKNNYLQPELIDTADKFFEAVDKIRQAKLPLKQHKEEVINLFNASTNLTLRGELAKIKSGLSKEAPHPSLKFVRQLRSGLWIVRYIRSWIEGPYGYTETVKHLRANIDQRITAAYKNALPKPLSAPEDVSNPIPQQHN